MAGVLAAFPLAFAKMLGLNLKNANIKTARASKVLKCRKVLRQMENFCMTIGPEYKLEENEDRKTRNRLLRLIKSESNCGFLILFTK